MKDAKNSQDDFIRSYSVIQLTFVVLTASVNDCLAYKCRNVHPICKDPVSVHILFAYLKQPYSVSRPRCELT